MRPRPGRGILKLRYAVVMAVLAVAGLVFSGLGRPGLRGAEPPPERLAHATFGGGCFWCMEPPFDAVAGVYSTTSGYAGGQEKDPTYKQVSSGRTGHAEVIQVAYDPAKVSYEQLLEVFWSNVDPTDRVGQFCDRGGQYRTLILYADETQRQPRGGSRRGSSPRSSPSRRSTRQRNITRTTTGRTRFTTRCTARAAAAIGVSSSSGGSQSPARAHMARRTRTQRRRRNAT